MNAFAKLFILFSFVMVVGALSGNIVSGVPWVQKHFFPSVSAEDDEEHEEEDAKDDEDDRKSSTSSSSSKETRTAIETVTEYRSVEKTIVVTDEEYLKDSDGDLLVDAIDPNPQVKQSEYFTDTDGDGVPDALDRYHDEDDFDYFDDIDTDTNGNGILDSYEQ